MGKNQQHKMMQRSRPSDDGAPEAGSEEPGADASFHTAEWHAARIAALTTERMSWEDWKKVQKDTAVKAAQAADEEEAQMRVYRAQLDADRLKRLSKGTNNAHLRAKGKDMKKRKDKKDKDKKSKKERKAGKKDKSEKKQKKSRRQSSSSSGSEDDSGAGGTGPVRLSDFLRQ